MIQTLLKRTPASVAVGKQPDKSWWLVLTILALNTPLADLAAQETGSGAAPPPVSSPEVRYETIFQQANLAYQESEYNEAIRLYRTLLGEAESAPAWYNLGNAYFRTEQWGRATHAFRRALALRPGLGEARANLVLVTDRSGVSRDALEGDWAEHWSNTLPALVWPLLAAGSFWAMAACLTASLFWRRSRGWLLAATFLFALIAVGAGIGLWGIHRESHQAVVLEADVSLRIAATTRSPEKASLEAGEIVRLTAQQGDYWLVQRSDGEQGYVHTREIGKLWGKPNPVPAPG